LTFDPLTLNDYSVSDVTRSIYVPNFNELEQSATQLLRFKYDQFWSNLQSRIRQEVDFHNSAACSIFFSELSGTNHIKICFRFQICCFVLKLGRVKGD